MRTRSLRWNPTVLVALFLVVLGCAQPRASLDERHAQPDLLSAADLSAAIPHTGCFALQVIWTRLSDSSFTPRIPPRVEFSSVRDTIYAGGLRYAEAFRVRPSDPLSWSELSVWHVRGDTLFLQSATRASGVRATLIQSAVGYQGPIRFFFDLGPQSGDGVLAATRIACPIAPAA